jgi:hypothetical protein
MGIDVRRATSEERVRDRKRRRLILLVGDNRYHASNAEMRRLRCKLNRMNLDERRKT